MSSAAPPRCCATSRWRSPTASRSASSDGTGPARLPPSTASWASWPSGAGASSSAGATSRSCPRTVGGSPGSATHRGARAGIGYSPEEAGIFPDLTVAENFLISQSLARAAGKTVRGDNGIDERVLALFPEIGQFTGRRGLYLSGGQKKMVAIGRAMTLSPSILLLDE